MALQPIAIGNNDRYLATLLGGSGDHLPPLASDVAGLPEPEEPKKNDGSAPQVQQLVDPDIPTNFNDLTDEQLAELIRNLIYRQEGGAR
jgi:hypothetical protein